MVMSTEREVLRVAKKKKKKKKKKIRASKRADPKRTSESDRCSLTTGDTWTPVQPGAAYGRSALVSHEEALIRTSVPLYRLPWSKHEQRGR